MNKLRGAILSEGIVIAKLIKLEEPDFRKYLKPFSSIEEEINLFEDALSKSEEQLKSVHQTAQHQLDNDTADIFHAHMMIAKDPEINKAVILKIRSFSITAYEAYDQTINHYVNIFQQLEDDYFKERISDVYDVAARIKKNILNIPIIDLSIISKPVIIAIKDLAPSQLAQVNTQFVLGFITEIGGKTSHSSIIARLMGVPMISNIKLSEVLGQSAILDGFTGDVILDPSDETVELYKQKIMQLDLEKKSLSAFVGKKSLSKDNVFIELAANIGSSRDLDYVTSNDADAIGLFRTEFLFLNRKQMPTEDEQFEHYKLILEAMKDKPVIIRTLDVGGDKVLPYLNLPSELNPFLGKRAIRLCFEQTELFKTQLRAILKASHYGHLKLMFPMIATKEEFLLAKSILIECQKQLDDDNVPYDQNLEVGIMIEIPSSALVADQLAKVVDFFSIGTNDLIQYTMAADRMSPDLSYLYQPFNPAILKLISMVTAASEKQGIWTGVCGEMASDMKALPLLIGLGVTELSMTPSMILKARQTLNTFKMDDLKELARKALLCDSESCVLKLLETY